MYFLFAFGEKNSTMMAESRIEFLLPLFSTRHEAKTVLTSPGTHGHHNHLKCNLNPLKANAWITYKAEQNCG